MTINGIPIHRLEEIELRLAGADHRPWGLSGFNALDDNGHRTIMRRSGKAQKKAIKAASRSADVRLVEKRNRGEITNAEYESMRDEGMVDAGVIDKSLTLFRRTDLATNEMMEFIEHAPEAVEDLLREGKHFHTWAEKLQTERDQAVKELVSSKVAASRAETKIADMRRAWRALVQEMGTKT